MRIQSGVANVPHLSDNPAMAPWLNTRELSKDTAQVLRDLPKTGPRVITRGGVTVGLLVPPSAAGLEADLDLLQRLRMGQALAASQKEAVLQGSSELSMEEIDAEIRAARKARKARRRTTRR